MMLSDGMLDMGESINVGTTPSLVSTQIKHEMNGACTPLPGSLAERN